jgi:hypothetical protein
MNGATDEQGRYERQLSDALCSMNLIREYKYISLIGRDKMHMGIREGRETTGPV